MKKIALILLCNLLVFCLALVFSERSFSLKLENYIESMEEESPSETTYKNFLLDLNIEDGAETKKIDIDINSKKYEKDKISVVDSDFRLSEELEKEILDTINNYGGRSSFYVISLKDGISIGYNIDTVYDAASSIKGPYSYYIYRLIDEGKIDSNMLLEYLPQYHNEGTGTIKNDEIGTKYTVEELVHRSIFVSDNIAHIMLHANFGVKGYNQMLDDLGTKQLYLTNNNPWGFNSCRSSAIVWQDIYNFSLSSPNGLKFFNEVLNTNFSYFDEAGINYHIANKAGWASKSIIESGIVFADMPYIATAMATKDGNYYAETHVTNLVGYIDKIMDEYQEYLKKTVK